MAGNIWYVGPAGAGSDGNPGTADRPFATVAAANAVVQPGDTVYFLAGTYSNTGYGALDASGARDIWKSADDTIVRIDGVHGSADAWITYAPAPGAEVVLTYDGNGAIRLVDSSFVRIEGFRIEGPNATLTLDQALDANWTYRVPVGTDAAGATVYEVRERDPAAQLTASVKSQDGEKPLLFNSPAIALAEGTHHVEIAGNDIRGSAAHAISAHGGNDYVTVRGNHIADCTWYTSNGTHAISFKGLDSIDASDAAKIVVESNTIVDCHNLLISWSPAKTAPVEMAIDEGKSIHVQNSVATPDADTGHVWDHGQVLIADNVIVRAGNAGITVNEARGVLIANNTIVDAGHVNVLLDGGLEATLDSRLAAIDQRRAVDGYVDAETLVAKFDGYRVASGGLRLSGTQDVTATNNLIAISDDRLFAVDAALDVTTQAAAFDANLYSGGKGLRFRADPAAQSAGFTAIEEPGFADPARADYRLLPASAAVDAGDGAVAAAVGADHAGTVRSDGALDVGAFEYRAGGPTGLLTIPEPTSTGRDPSLELRSFAMPTDAFTIEFQLALPVNPGNNAVVVLQYGVAGAGATASEVAITTWSDYLDLYIAGLKFDTHISNAALVGGSPHRVSISYDSATGRVKTYLDGALQDDGFLMKPDPVVAGQRIVATGETLTTGLALNLGSGGGNDATPAYTFGDVRIFDHPRSDALIAAAHATALADPAAEPGLAGYWTVADATTLASQVEGVGPIVLDEDIANYPRTARPAIIDTGDPEVDALIDSNLMQSIYADGSVITYTFDLSSALDPNEQDSSGAPLQWQAVNPAMEARSRQLLQAFNDLTGVTLVEVAEADQPANLYFASRNNVATAYVAGHRGGIVNVFNTATTNPNQGSYADHLILHEMGHALGLPHPELPAGFKGHDYSVMTGYAFEGATSSVFSDSYGPETWMLADVAALQYQFGANYAFNDGDTVYSFSQITGETFVDGVGQGVGRSNHIYRTIWDGNGNDTYDLSTYVSDLAIDLAPGAFSTFASTQVARLGSLDGVAQYASGNVANAYLHQGDVRSLIENAVGGRGDDLIAGNAAANVLSGGHGRDHLSGGDGDDRLFGDSAGGDTPAPAIIGLDLNAGSATGQSIRLDDVGGLPTNALTLEFVVKFTSVPQQQWFLSFPGISLLLDPTNAGAPGLWVRVDNSWTYSEISIARLTDGDAHQVSFTWDAATGAFAHYLDGVAVKTGSGLETATTLSATGIGDLGITAKGAIGEVRIYDRALTASEILASANLPLADPATTPDLAIALQTRADGSVVNAVDGNLATTTAGVPAVVLVTATAYDDRLEGGTGRDLLVGGKGDDLLDGGDGVDTVDHSVGATGVEVDAITVDLGAGAARDGFGDVDTLISIENVIGTDQTTDGFGDVIVGSAVSNLLSALGAADYVDGAGGDDTLDGGSGDDALVGGLGADIVYGGDGNDVILLDDYSNPGAGGGDDTADGGDGNDLLWGYAGDDTLTGGDGDDAIVGNDFASTSTGFDLMFGGAGNDLFFVGLAGSARMDGGAGNDSFFGAAGADTIIGGTGSDYAYGAQGADTFVFRSADLVSGDVDIVYFFSKAEGDTLQLDASLAGQITFTDLTIPVADVGQVQSVYLTHGSGWAAAVYGTTAAELQTAIVLA